MENKTEILAERDGLKLVLVKTGGTGYEIYKIKCGRFIVASIHLVHWRTILPYRYEIVGFYQSETQFSDLETCKKAAINASKEWLNYLFENNE